jgi:inositol-phosphate phosphatase / L-galactose 1-phosphate phosphatase / histidinol-phosphatase
MTQAVSAARIALAEALADAARDVIRGHFRRPLAVDDKSDLSPVTIADRAAEAAMRALIERHFPEDGIIGEEHGSVRAEAEHVWVLDPIDGTKSFISGIPLFGTLIALARRGRPVLGIIDQPILEERWLGAAGRVTTLNGAPARARRCAALAQASLFCTAPEIMFRGADAAGFARLQHAVKLFRAGADCYAYAQLASGLVDLVVEGNLKPYDYCALAPVIEGAGGSVTDWQGRALDLGSDGRIIACGDPSLAAPTRALLGGG